MKAIIKAAPTKAASGVNTKRESNTPELSPSLLRIWRVAFLAEQASRAFTTSAVRFLLFWFIFKLESGRVVYGGLDQN